MARFTKSWLSREVILFTLFAGYSTLYLYRFPESTAGGWLAVLLGFITLFTIDRVYKAAMDGKHGKLHSADLVITGVFLSGILLDSSLLALLAGSVKLGLYLHRKSLCLKAGRTLRPLASGIRIIAGFLVPIMLWPETFTNVHLYVMISATVGELIDRSEFYMDLETRTPCRQITIDLEKRIEADSQGDCSAVT